MLRKFLALLILVAAIIPDAGAQVVRKKGDFNTLGGGLSLPKTGGTGVIGEVKGKESIQMEYGKYNDDTLDEQTKEFQERDWLNEDTAWQRACSMNTKAAYQRYAAIYPNGLHIAEAHKKIIDFQVEETIHQDHGELPNIERTVADDSSPTSNVVIRNNTGQTLTVMYSGLDDSKKIRIPPGGKDMITVKNGLYGIAASVPEKAVKPFAGHTTLQGGEYQIGFWIVRSF